MTVLTAQSIRDILGYVDEDLALRLVDAGASEADLLAAMAWLDEDDEMGRSGAEPPTGAVAQLCRILEETRASPDEDKAG